MKNQKNSGFFWFFAWIVFTCLLKICPKNQKRPEFFLVFWLTSSKSSFKKPKNLEFFVSFFKVMTKKQKNSRKTKKRNTHEPQTKHSLKSFGFLVFSRFFWFLVFSRFSQQGAQNLRSRNARSVFDIGVAIMFSLFVAIYRKKHIPLPALVSTISLCKRLSPQYVRQFILNFFL